MTDMLNGDLSPVEPIITDEAAVSPTRLLPSRRESGHWWTAVLPALVIGTIALGAWYLITYVVLEPRRRFLMPAPHDVVQVGFFEWENLDVILDALLRTATIAFIGLTIAIVLGIGTAVLMSQTIHIERGFFPYLVMLQAVPILALTPLIGFWFGYGTNARVIVCVIISFFPIVLNTLFGLQSAEPGMHDLFTLEHASRATRLWKLMFPAGMPAIFAGLRISAGLSVIGAIVGDFFFGQGEAGLGQMLKRFAANARSEELFATMIVASLLGVAVFLLFGRLQKRAIGRWYDPRTSP